MGKAIDKLLENVNYSLNSPASYAGINRVFNEARRRNPQIKMSHVHDFLHRQRVYTMHHPLRKRFPRLVTKPTGLHTDWQADLAIFDQLAAQNDGYRYLLVCVDVLSRKLFVAPVRTKRSVDMIEAFEQVWKQNAGILPHKLYTDRGLEFEAKKMKEYFQAKDIDKRVVYSQDVHASMAERANRTIKERLYRYFSQENTLKWKEAVLKIVDALNSSVNRITGVTPNSITFENSRKLYKRLYKNGEIDITKEKSNQSSLNRQLLSKGQFVRITKENGKFEKGYLPNYTDELFRVRVVNDAHKPVTYHLEDLEGEHIKGIFYREELVPTTAPDETTHRVAEILRSRKSRTGIKQYFVRWIGYGDRHNSWVNEADIVGHQ